MRMICKVNANAESITVYSLCKRSKHALFIERETLSDSGSSLTHYDINMSWRRFKKGIQKQGNTFSKFKIKYYITSLFN